MNAAVLVECAGIQGLVAVPEVVGTRIGVLVVDSIERATRPPKHADAVRYYACDLPVGIEGPVLALGSDPDGRDLVSIGGRGRFQRPLIDVVQHAHPRATWSANDDPQWGGVAVARVDGRIVGVVMGCRA